MIGVWYYKIRVQHTFWSEICYHVSTLHLLVTPWARPIPCSPCTNMAPHKFPHSAIISADSFDIVTLVPIVCPPPFRYCPSWYTCFGRRDIKPAKSFSTPPTKRQKGSEQCRQMRLFSRLSQSVSLNLTPGLPAGSVACFSCWNVTSVGQGSGESAIG